MKFQKFNHFSSWQISPPKDGRWLKSIVYQKCSIQISSYLRYQFKCQSSLGRGMHFYFIWNIGWTDGQPQWLYLLTKIWFKILMENSAKIFPNLPRYALQSFWLCGPACMWGGEEMVLCEWRVSVYVHTVPFVEVVCTRLRHLYKWSSAYMCS